MEEYNKRRKRLRILIENLLRILGHFIFSN